MMGEVEWCKINFWYDDAIFWQLCLMSGEIIQMSNKMNLIFEPADLEQASPATVSRCGMIYLEPHQMGWRPFKESYMQYELPEKLSQENRDMINDLFEWLVDPCLEYIRHNCKLFVNASEMHLVQSMMRLYTCLQDEIRTTLEHTPAEGDEPNPNALSNQQVLHNLSVANSFYENIHLVLLFLHAQVVDKFCTFCMHFISIYI